MLWWSQRWRCYSANLFGDAASRQVRDGPSSWWSGDNEESLLWGEAAHRWTSGTSISAWLTGLALGRNPTASFMCFVSPLKIRPMNGLHIMNEIILKSTAHVTTPFNMECFCSWLICSSTQQTLLVKLFPHERSKISLVGYFYWEAEEKQSSQCLETWYHSTEWRRDTAKHVNLEMWPEVGD